MFKILAWQVTLSNICPENAIMICFPWVNSLPCSVSQLLKTEYNCCSIEFSLEASSTAKLYNFCFMSKKVNHFCDCACKCKLVSIFFYE